MKMQQCKRLHTYQGESSLFIKLKRLEVYYGLQAFYNSLSYYFAKGFMIFCKEQQQAANRIRATLLIRQSTQYELTGL